MLRRRSPACRRVGTATVEMALVMNLIIVPLILGLWEMGRYVQVQQVVANATREGARMGAQAVTIKPDGAQILVRTNPPIGDPSVKSAVMQYLSGAGLTKLRYEDVDVTFTFLAAESGDPPLLNAVAGATEPYQGVQNQRFRVTVTITDETVPGSGTLKAVGSRPLRERVLWTTLGLVRPDTVAFQVDWVMMVDLPFNVNATLPGW